MLWFPWSPSGVGCKKAQIACLQFWRAVTHKSYFHVMQSTFLFSTSWCSTWNSPASGSRTRPCVYFKVHEVHGRYKLLAWHTSQPTACEPKDYSNTFSFTFCFVLFGFLGEGGCFCCSFLRLNLLIKLSLCDLALLICNRSTSFGRWTVFGCRKPSNLRLFLFSLFHDQDKSQSFIDWWIQLYKRISRLWLGWYRLCGRVGQSNWNKYRKSEDQEGNQKSFKGKIFGFPLDLLLNKRIKVCNVSHQSSQLHCIHTNGSHVQMSLCSLTPSAVERLDARSNQT